MDFMPFERDIAESIILDDDISDGEMDHDDPAFAYGNLVLWLILIQYINFK
jgi:hypothetical protein